MLTDDAAAAAVAGQREQLREEAGREETRVSTPPAAGDGGDFLRMLPPQRDEPPDALAPQERLIRHLKEHRVAVRERGEPERNGVAQPGTGIAVVDGEKAVFRRERFNLRVLADDHNAHKLPARHGLERAADYAHAADVFLQFVAPEAPGIARRHDDAADFPAQDRPRSSRFP